MSNQMWQAAAAHFTYRLIGSKGLLVGRTGDAAPDEWGIELSVSARGQWSKWEPFGATRKRTQSALRVAVVIHDVTIGGREFKPGQLVEQLIPCYYTELEAKSGDYCAYCGAFNGTHGEYRIGFDCCGCHSN